MISPSRNALVYASVGIAAAALAISLAVAAMAPQPAPAAQAPDPQTREFYLFTQVEEAVEEELDVPPDLFFPTQMTVNMGDRIIVHFYNLEPEESQEHHTFTMANSPYQMNHDLNAGEQKAIEFTASEAGVFEYLCVYHQPTMRGQLVVLGQ